MAPFPGSICRNVCPSLYADVLGSEFSSALIAGGSNVTSDGGRLNHGVGR
jgi:hypothetical protein